MSGALLVSLLVAWARSTLLPVPWWLLWICFCVAMASHGLLDGCNDAGLGIAYLSPFATTRYFLPWRPIRTPCIGGAYFRHGPWGVLGSEVRWVWLPLGVLVTARLLGRTIGKTLTGNRHLSSR